MEKGGVSVQQAGGAREMFIINKSHGTRLGKHQTGWATEVEKAIQRAIG